MKPAYFENFNTNKLKVYTENAILDAFQYIANNLEVEYNYPQGGCQQRAHISSLILDKKYKIDHAKIWLFAPAVISAYEHTMLQVKDNNNFTPGNKIEWGYHVASVIKIKKNNKVNLYVIDPALKKNKPVTILTWFNAITNSSSGSFTYTAQDIYFFNCYQTNDGIVSTVFNGSFYAYDEESRQNLVLEKGLATCDTAMYIYNNHIKEMPGIKKNKKKLNDLKAIFGNATAIDCIVAQNNSANTPNTLARYVITHYASIINEAKNFFNDRLVYWVTVTNQLTNTGNNH